MTNVQFSTVHVQFFIMKVCNKLPSIMCAVEHENIWNLRDKFGLQF